MYSRKMMPYVIELVVFTVVSIFMAIVFLNNYIIVKWSWLVCLLLMSLVIWLLAYIIPFIPFAAKALIDMIFRSYESLYVTFDQQFIFRSSSFLDVNSKENIGQVKERYFYKIIATYREEPIVFTSSDVFELVKGETYLFTFSRRSRVLVDVKKQNTMQRP